MFRLTMWVDCIVSPLGTKMDIPDLGCMWRCTVGVVVMEWLMYIICISRVTSFTVVGAVDLAFCSSIIYASAVFLKENFLGGVYYWGNQSGN